MTDRQQSVFPHLVVDDAVAALEFYKKGLGATETMRMSTDDGERILHAAIEINGATLFVRDDFPGCPGGHDGSKLSAPKALGGTTVTLHLEVADCDEAVRRAATAGATVTMPPMDAFWGSRYAQVVDPFGHAWSFAHPLPERQG